MIYEYQCKTCDKEYELIVKMADADKQKCPDCNKKLIRIMSVPNKPIFKARRYLP